MIYQHFFVKQHYLKSFNILNRHSHFISFSNVSTESFNKNFNNNGSYIYYTNNYDKRKNCFNTLNKQVLLISSKFHTNTKILYKDPESKAEKTVNLLKENLIEINKEPVAVKQETDKASSTGQIMYDKKITKNPLENYVNALETGTDHIDKTLSADHEKTQLEEHPKRLTLWQRIVNELKHYYDGFKLLYFETKIAFSLLKKVLYGHTLTRRERRQFTRTAADLFRLVPFSLFIIVPFLEFTLPLFLKLFPNMLPSTFKEESAEQEKLRKKLKAKLEMAKFLQDTLEETALKPETKSNSNTLNQKFSEFMKKIRTKGEQPSNEELLKYSSLFENELTLDNLSRQQLIALCQILDVSTLANIPPNHILRFQLRMRIRNLEADDRMIVKEGVENLNIEELQQACRDRGMRAIGLSESRLKNQLEQWLELHLNKKIPLSLLLLSRALYLPENLPTQDLIKSTISALPKSIEEATIAKIAEVTGAKVDNKIKLELLKQEEAQIKLENAAKEHVKEVTTDTSTREIPNLVLSLKPEKIVSPKVEEIISEKIAEKENLIDNAKIINTEELVSPVEIKEINQIIENLPANETNQVKAEIEELKKDVDEYKEDIKEVEQLTFAENSPAKLKETKSAKILSKRVQKLISDMDNLVEQLEKDNQKFSSKNLSETTTTANTITIDELMATIKSLKGITTDVQEKKFLKVLESLDQDKDGKIDDLKTVLKVFDLIEQENVKVSKDQLGKILSLLEKEKLIEIEERKKQISNESK